MVFNIKNISKDTIIGHIDGNRIRISNLEEGQNFTAEIYRIEDSVGRKVNKIIRDNDGKQIILTKIVREVLLKTKPITKEQGFSVLILYFNTRIYPKIQKHNLQKSKLFRHFVDTIIPNLLIKLLIL